MADDLIPAQQRMLIEHECAKVVRRSLNALDNQDIAGFLALFADDAVVRRPSHPERPLIGKAAITEEYEARPPVRLTFHLCTNLVVDVASAERAEAYCHVLLYTAERSGTGEALPIAASRQLAGEFRDTLVRRNGEWLFSLREGRMILAVEPGGLR